MGLDSTRIAGVYISRLEPIHDDRGSFTRTFDASEFIATGLDPTVAQASVSRNTSKGTLRGMHLQREPHGETKLIRCLRGGVFDVAVDVRPQSGTYGEWISFTLAEDDGLAIVLAPGIAHGFVTLTDAVELSYQISTPYRPDAAIGFRWDDPDVGIDWPLEPAVVSSRDQTLPLLAELNQRMST